MRRGKKKIQFLLAVVLLMSMALSLLPYSAFAAGNLSQEDAAYTEQEQETDKAIGGETGDGETGDGETGDGETGDGETGDGETGDGETGDGETGRPGTARSSQRAKSSIPRTSCWMIGPRAPSSCPLPYPKSGRATIPASTSTRISAPTIPIRGSIKK